MRAAVGDGVMAFACFVGSICGDRSEFRVSGELAHKLGFGQHGRVTDGATGNLDSSDLERLFVNAEVDLAP